MKCEKLLRQYLYPFLDDELTSEESLDVQAHLNECAACTARIEAEARLGRQVQRGLGPIEAPPHLIGQVRRTLRSEGRGERRWLRSSGGGLSRLAVAAALAVALLLPPGAAFGSAVEGLLVCFHCEELGVPVHLHDDCDLPGHRTGFKDDGGQVWQMMESDSTRDLLMNGGVRGQRVRITGRYLDEYGYVSVRNVLSL